LYAFFYALLHILIFTGLDYLFDPALIRAAIFEKRYALAGLAAFLMLLPLAITSTRGWMKRMGKDWKRLHRLVYLAALLVVTHYAWSVKSDIRQPLAFGTAVLLLLVARLPAVRRATTRLRGWLSSRQSTLYRKTLEGQG
jgi:sulfoxide reductase heme-binding subunit YedZ